MISRGLVVEGAGKQLRALPINSPGHFLLFPTPQFLPRLWCSRRAGHLGVDSVLGFCSPGFLFLEIWPPFLKLKKCPLENAPSILQPVVKAGGSGLGGILFGGLVFPLFSFRRCLGIRGANGSAQGLGAAGWGGLQRP